MAAAAADRVKEESSVSTVPVTRKPWTVMAYTVADDPHHPLDTGAQDELQALCEAADFGQVSIAAQVDFKKPKGVFRGTIVAAPPKTRGWKVLRAEDHPLWRKILGGIDAERSTLEVQREARDLNSAKGNVLREFLRYGQKECPADRYVVFFYGHAAGPMGLFNDADSGQRETDSLRLNDLAGSLETTEGRADVVVFRDCFMNTLETAYQLREATEFLIATQSLAPAKGIWPYSNFLNTLLPSADSSDVGLGLVKHLAKYLDDPANRGRFEDVPYSLIDLSAAEATAAALKDLTEALLTARETPKRARACGESLEAARVGSPESASDPGDPALLDVLTMCDNLMTLKGDPVCAPARTLSAVVQGRLVRWHHSQKGRHRGMSVFYKPVKAADASRSYLQAEDVGSGGRRCRPLQDARSLPGDRLAPDCPEPIRGLIRARRRAHGTGRRRLPRAFAPTASWWPSSAPPSRRRACRPCLPVFPLSVLPSCAPSVRSKARVPELDRGRVYCVVRRITIRITRPAFVACAL